MPRLVALLVCLVTIALSTAGPHAQEPDACDRLTAEDASPAADANAAIVACEAALAAQPGEPRIVHQYALALERAGRIEDARRMYEWAAADGYAPAVEAVTRLSSTGAELGWTEAERRALSESMAGISAAMRRFQNELPPDPSDPLTIIAEIGTDPAVITEWVATNTRLIPYAGSLRGPRGVLSDRSGNSLDRALALAALLSAAGEDVRLARASLDEGQVDALLLALANLAAPRPLQADVRTPQEAADLLAESGELPAEMASAIIDRVSRRNQQIAAAVAEQSAVLVPLLLEAMEGAQAAATAQQRPRDHEAVREHYWAQVQRGAVWTDYDPQASVIGPLTAAEKVDVDRVPDALRHTVTIRVIVEIQSAVGRQEEVLVSWTGYPASLGETLVSLGHVADARNAVKQLVEAGAASTQVLTAIDGTMSWMPVLLVDGTLIADKLFTSNGAVRAVDPNVFTQGGRGALSVFGEAAELLGADEAPPEPPAGVPTAEWIEVEVSVPGAASRIERRAVFDLLGPSARAAAETLTPTQDQLRLRALQLAGTTDMLILGATPSATELKRSGSAGIAETLENLRALIQRDAPLRIDDIPPEPRLALSLRQFARSRLLDGVLAISSPNVFMHHQRLGWDPLMGVGWQEQIDIVFNDLAGPPGAFAARLRQGVLDTVLEGAVADSGPEGNTALAMLEDISSGEKWVLLRPQDGHELSAYAPDLKARIGADLARGYYALAPMVGTSAEAWWRIDPTTGTALGMTPAGGGAMAEYTLLFTQGIASGLCLAGLGTGVAAIMTGGDGLGNLLAGAAFCAAAGGFGAVGASVLGGGLAGIAEAGAAGALTVGIINAGTAAGGLVLGF